jgi:hypothetical protein
VVDPLVSITNATLESTEVGSSEYVRLERGKTAGPTPSKAVANADVNDW